MSEIKILIEGYAKQIANGWLASSTVTLIKASNKNIIVDPGCNGEKLIAALIKENLKVGDIDFVLLTHNHLDHTLLAGIFPNARVLTTEEMYKNDNQILHNNKIPETDLEIIQTTGHAGEHCSLVVPTEKGVYVVAGDVFWYVDGEAEIADAEKIDDAHPAEVDMTKLIESRKKILEIADWIIPGHGKMFKVKK
ncbi:MBL fold metallo-hydrolase [Patescibacteria group bacterium]|nr:MBL fold metallo-hydrolase [Patescibacteria group bacterium]MBU4056980.1 MBL fold metallo-hydrolase [Patescibacteria group bacterium]MBU4368873.1 MBL fold metallo-hydrolase [Patescibacteria group bacterium]